MNLVKLRALILENAAFYDTPMNELRLKMFADELKDLDLFQIELAYRSLRKEPTRRTMPLPADVRSKIKPTIHDKEEANLLAARIIRCIGSHGYTWSHGFYMGGEMRWAGKEGKVFKTYSEAVQSELGEVGEYVLKVMGGFSQLCERCGDQPGILQAQLRDITTSVLQKSKNGTLEESLKLPGSQANQEIAAQVKALTAGALKELE